MSKRKSEDEGDIPISARVHTHFRHDVIRDVLKSQFTNPKNRITDDAVDIITQMTKVMVVEATARAAKQASLESRTTITLDNIETILPQMMLDFP